MTNSAIFILLFLLWFCGKTKPNSSDFSQLVGGPCEGCEAVFEFGKRTLSATDTLPDFAHAATKIKLTGTIYQPDGKTPAKDVILYIYHTDHTGIYPTKGNEAGWAKRHGYLRGWAKTDASGSYTFYTGKPAAYPGGESPAHIHPTILEPNGKYYYVEDFYFEDDPLLTQKELAPEAPRGGTSGLLRLKKEGSLLVGERNFMLGRNVPGYE